MPTVRARFIEPMLLQQTSRLPEGPHWLYELKLDGYRAIAFKADGRVQLRSRKDKVFAARYSAISSAMSALPEGTIIDGEIVALDETGRPAFNLLQNYGSSRTSLVYYIFDVLILAGRDVMNEPLSIRRKLLSHEIMPKLRDPIRESPTLDVGLQDLVQAIKAQGLEGWSPNAGTVVMSRVCAPAPGRRCASTRCRSLSSAGIQSAAVTLTR